ncbi:hypothetical protein HDV05_005988 [Chytridiales sp. JEL 0842]|nr:hypothetical protein HDV05_005988 [Chytridiales sp. JEL 0842]
MLDQIPVLPLRQSSAGNRSMPKPLLGIKEDAEMVDVSPQMEQSRQQQQQPQQPRSQPPRPSRNSTSNNSSRDLVVPVAVQETPMINKNRALRGDIPRTFEKAKAPAELPHESIDSAQLYRHIDADQPDPVRMRQLLAWCAQRARAAIAADLKEDVKYGVDINAMALAVQDDIIKGLLGKQINTSWYHRSETYTSPAGSGNGKLLPNPRNVENEAKKNEKKAELERLLAEEKIWTDILRKRTQAIKTVTVSDVIESEERLPEIPDYASTILSEWTKSNMEQLQLDIHDLQSSVYTAYSETETSRRECENVFSLWLKAFVDEHLTKEKKAEPFDILRLMPAPAH